MTKKRKRPAAPRPAVRPAPVFADWPGASDLRFADAGEVLERLGQAVAERDRYGVAIDELVRRGRAQGLTWTELARSLGVTPQAVQKRYGAPVASGS